MTEPVETEDTAPLIAILEEIVAGSQGLVRDWPLLTQAEAALERGGLEGLVQFYRASIEQPGSRGMWIKATPRGPWPEDIGVRIRPLHDPLREYDSSRMIQANATLLESEVRQWLRDRPGMAFCGRCVALLTRNSLPARPAIAAAVLALSRSTSGFLPGRCQCGELGVRYYPPAHRR